MTTFFERDPAAQYGLCLKRVFFLPKKLIVYTYWWKLGQGTYNGCSWFFERKQSVESVKSVENLTKFALLIIVSEGVMGWSCNSFARPLFFEVISDVKKTLASGSFDVIVPGWNTVKKVKSWIANVSTLESWMK